MGGSADGRSGTGGTAAEWRLPKKSISRCSLLRWSLVGCALLVSSGHKRSPAWSPPLSPDDERAIETNAIIVVPSNQRFMPISPPCCYYCCCRSLPLFFLLLLLLLFGLTLLLLYQYMFTPAASSSDAHQPNITDHMVGSFFLLSIFRFALPFHFDQQTANDRKHMEAQRICYAMLCYGFYVALSHLTLFFVLCKQRIHSKNETTTVIRLKKKKKKKTIRDRTINVVCLRSFPTYNNK